MKTVPESISVQMKLMFTMLAKVDWDQIDDRIWELIQKTPLSVAENLTLFFMNGGNVNVEPLKILPTPPDFDVDEFFPDEDPEGCSFGLLTVADRRSAEVNFIDYRRVKFRKPILEEDDGLRDDESDSIDSRYIRLGSAAFLAFWKNRHRLPEELKMIATEKALVFEGDIYGDDGLKYVLTMLYSEARGWRYEMTIIHPGWEEQCISVTIPVKRR